MVDLSIVVAAEVADGFGEPGPEFEPASILSITIGGAADGNYRASARCEDKELGGSQNGFSLP